MAKARSKKDTEVKALVEKLGRMHVAVATTTAGLKVKDVNELRSLLRKSGVDYVVAKKTLVRRALEQASLSTIDFSSVSESMALSFGYDDEVAPAKALATFAKTHDSIKFVGGILNGTFVDGARMKSLSAMPTRNEMLGRVVGTIAAPLSGFVRVLSGNLTGLVRVLDGYREKMASVT